MGTSTTLLVKYGSHVTLGGLWYPYVLSVTSPLDWSGAEPTPIPLPPCLASMQVLGNPVFREDPNWARGVFLMMGA